MGVFHILAARVVRPTCFMFRLRERPSVILAYLMSPCFLNDEHLFRTKAERFKKDYWVKIHEKIGNLIVLLFNVSAAHNYTYMESR